MHILGRYKFCAKLAMLLGLSAFAIVASIGASAYLMHQRTVSDRVDMLRAVVQSTISIAKSLENRVAEHALTREQALATLRGNVHAMASIMAMVTSLPRPYTKPRSD